MDNAAFLEQVFKGYVLTYRKHCWHVSATYADMTQNEINWFAELGQMFGFYAYREYKKADLVWMDENKRVFMYLERENEDGRAVSEAIRKLLKPLPGLESELKIAVLGWVTDDTFREIKTCLEEGRHNGFMAIAFVGNWKDNANRVKCLIFSGDQKKELSARAKIDCSRHWYLCLEQTDLNEPR